MCDAMTGKGRIQEAERSLQWLRGWVSAQEVQTELSMLVKSIQSSEAANQETRSWQPFLRRTFLRPYLIVALAFLVGHFGGMTTLQTYAVSTCPSCSVGLLNNEVNIFVCIL